MSFVWCINCSSLMIVCQRNQGGASSVAHSSLMCEAACMMANVLIAVSYHMLIYVCENTSFSFY